MILLKHISILYWQGYRILMPFLSGTISSSDIQYFILSAVFYVFSIVGYPLPIYSNTLHLLAVGQLVKISLFSVVGNAALSLVAS